MDDQFLKGINLKIGVRITLKIIRTTNTNYIRLICQLILRTREHSCALIQFEQQ